MLSSVLRSPRAIAANIAIMRAFVQLRGVLLTHRALADRIDDLERRHAGDFAAVVRAIRRLARHTPVIRPGRRIGFTARKNDGRRGRPSFIAGAGFEPATFGL